MTRSSSIQVLAWTLLLSVSGALARVQGQDLAWFEDRLTEHRLENGLTFLIYNRPGAPVVSFFTHVNVGSAQEVPGITGLAHMFEHMAFKGTSRVGTKDYDAEVEALARVDAAYAAYDAERRRPGGSNEEKLESLKQALEKAQEEAGELIVPNEFEEVLNRNGAVGLNAGTGADFTIYFYSLPANKVELWAYLESERFLDPVLREFYKERDVVMEERRLRVESQPVGRLLEQLQGVAFLAHPYKNNTVGHMSDLETFTREDGVAFFNRHYVPANMTVAVVGAVEPKELIPMLERYFGRLPAGERPEPLRTVEPRQIAERIVRLPDASQPIYLEAYHRPDATHEDSVVLDAISELLATGRTSRLHRRMVQKDKIAAQVAALNGYPGSRYPNLLLMLAVATPGHTNEEIQAALHEEIEKLKTEPISDEELRRVKTRARAGLIRSLASNFGVGQQLVTYQSLFGDWRELFHEVERIETVSQEDIQRVAKTTFVATNRTVAMIVDEKPAAAGGEEGP